MNWVGNSFVATFLLISAAIAVAQDRPERAANEFQVPPLAFRADFDGPPSELPLTMASVQNKELRFATYGPGKDMVSKTYHPKPPQQGGFIGSITCLQICGITLFVPNEYLDMSGLSRVTWRTQQGGLHQLRLMIKLANGKMLVSDQSVGASTYWRVSEMIIRDLRWRELDTNVMNDETSIPGTDAWVDRPDLSKVAEVGWTDLQAGSGNNHPGDSSRVSWIEVYAARVPRN